MGLMFLKKFSFLFLLISASFLTTSFAGRGSNFIKMSAGYVNAVKEVTPKKPMREEEKVTIIHERLLRANTRDYGRYDPTPTFSKPPFKLIPN